LAAACTKGRLDVGVTPRQTRTHVGVTPRQARTRVGDTRQTDTHTCGSMLSAISPGLWPVHPALRRLGDGVATVGKTVLRRLGRRCVAC
jgi:hypothetical protein